jgi:hypothetical protein
MKRLVQSLLILMVLVLSAQAHATTTCWQYLAAPQSVTASVHTSGAASTNIQDNVGTYFLLYGYCVQSGNHGVTTPNYAQLEGAIIDVQQTCYAISGSSQRILRGRVTIKIASSAATVVSSDYVSTGSPSLAGVGISIIPEVGAGNAVTKQTMVNGIVDKEIDWICTSQSTYFAPGGNRGSGD